MSSLIEVESAIANFSEMELSDFRIWFENFDNEIWDRQLEMDVTNGKMTKFAEIALKEHFEKQTIAL